VRKFIATPGAEVIGSAMQNLFVSMNREDFANFVEQVLTKYGVKSLDNNTWYPHQLSLDIFKMIEVNHKNASENLVALGMAYVETATFPPEINTVFTALSALSLTYNLNIRNVRQDEGYVVKKITENHIQIEDRNPFPHDTVYGFIWGISKRFRAHRDVFPTIKRTFFNAADPNADGALYDVTF
jgi:hypothetical protein